MSSPIGVVFNIVQGSFVDGYGLRTTVFLKGCPLRCLWCCNVEGQKNEPELKFVAANCDNCGKCIETCPVGAIALNIAAPEKKLLVDRDKCTMCGKCVDICIKGAFEIIGKTMTVDEVMTIIKKNEMFYRQSGGGVTIGGGEATAQPNFTLALVRECKKNYIHIAIDTCGFTTTPAGIAALEEADLLLFDLKGMDPQAHLNNTGVANEIILENLCRLDMLNKSIIIRIPLIPGYNDSKENIEAAADFLGKLKSIERVDIIAYHEYGKIKYDELGIAYPLQHVRNDSVTQDALDDVKRILEHRGLHVQFGG